MEDLLLNLAKESSSKYANIEKLAMDAYALLEYQQCSTRDPAYILREKCFAVFKTCFDTKRSKLISHAMNGIYKMIRDDRFQTNYEPEDDSLWFPSQLLHAFASMQTQSDDTQVDMLKALLYVACSTYWTINGRIIIQVITTCSEVYENGTQATRAASQAACSQILSSFCHFLDEECQELEISQKTNASGILCFNEVIPILQFICCKVDEIQSKGRFGSNMAFFLECLHTLTSCLPQKIHANRHFTTFLWQKLCPALIAFLGSPRVDKNIVSREDRQVGDNSEVGRGSGGLASALSFDSYQSKVIYSIGNQLVRLVGCVGSLRPVLESIYHRMLLYPPPQHRLEALKALNEVLRSSDRLADIAGPILVEDDRQSFCKQSDMALTRLIMDSIEESSHCSEIEVLFTSVRCISTLLSTLLDLSSGKGINDRYIEKVNTIYPNLASCDYTGPLTYDSISRLPHSYREIIKYKLIADNDSYVSRSSSGHSSGETEGPEEGFQSNESDVEEVTTEVQKIQDEQSARLKRARKASDITESTICSLNQKVKSSDSERENCRLFVKSFLSFLPSLLQLRSTLQVDEALQEFSSKYCQGIVDNCTNSNQVTIMNADGIYLAAYAALRFNLKLIRAGYYKGNNIILLPLSEGEFVEEVHGSGILIYLSANWLSELYQQVLVTNLLQMSGYNPAAIENNDFLPLINLLSDIGDDINQHGSRLLSDYQRLEQTFKKPQVTAEIEAGRKVSRRILTCCWDSMINVLSTSLRSSSKSANVNTRMKIIRKNKTQESLLKECLEISLESLQKAAELTNIVGIQDRCGSVFSLLVNAACPELSCDKVASSFIFADTKHKLYPSQVLSMNVILKNGLALGSYAPDCWKHIFRCALFVCHLEQQLFRHANSDGNVANKLDQPKINTPEASCTSENLKLAFHLNDNNDDEVMDVYSFLATSPSASCTQEQTIVDIIEESKTGCATNILSNEYASRIVCVLSQLVDVLFEDAALKLNLESLACFVKDLCSASHSQLFSQTCNSEARTKEWWNLRNITKASSAIKINHSLFLSRIDQVMLKCIRSGRPLIHIMKIWSLIGPHYIEAACSKEQAVSKISIVCMHDAITALLNEQTEFPHFHFNEALFKPFEILLCLELCDSDIQDQIVSCICEFVEGSKTDIRSGWRSLFGGLKVVSSIHLSSLLDVFHVFLDTDNTLVFSNAAVDFITCLVRHVRGTADLVDNILVESDKSLKLATEALKYLHQCSGILASMYNMPSCPVFHTAHSIQISTRKIDATFVDKELILFGMDEVESRTFKLAYDPLSLDDDNDCTSLYSMDKPSGVLRVWASMIESLSFTVIVATGKCQSHALDMLFVILRELIIIPGVEFGLFCINYIVLPSVEHWLHKIPPTGVLDSSDHNLTNFKQCCGALTDIIAFYLQHLYKNDCIQKGTLALKQLVILMMELIVNSRETIARLGCACIRHIILSTGSMLNGEQWDIVCVALYKACILSLQPLCQLMAAFYSSSQSFYGDLAQVKVAARRDSTYEENCRLRQLSQQIFLLENQYDEYKPSTYNNMNEEERSYILLLCPKDIESNEYKQDHSIIRIPYRCIVVGLLANQLILHTVATLLVQGMPHIVPSLANVLLQIPNLISSDSKQSSTGEMKLFGMTAYMKELHVRILTNCLDYSYEKAVAFDSRPGLKFLMQKVAGIEKAANLYRQAGASWTLKIVTLFELYLYESNKSGLNLEKVKEHMEKFDFICESTNEAYLNELIYEQEDTSIVYLYSLRLNFDKLCEKYIDVVLDKDGLYSIIDSVCDQPIFFLIPQMDDFEFASKKSEYTESEDKSVKMRDIENEICQKVQTMMDHRNHKIEQSIEVGRKFKFSDFTDLTPENERDNEDVVEYKVEECDEQSHKESVYMMASSKNIDTVVEEYTKRKKSCSMLPANRRNSSAIIHFSVPEPLPPEIEQQRKTSIHKDSETHLAVWAENLISVFDILAQLKDDEFRILLPILFNGVRRLTAHATHPSLKHAIAEFFHRVAIVYGFSP